ncbi:MAG: hypothetical protein VKJ64_14515, partial [Leptolyngbyaceae bacterium]|nr:hypothetical protein [Leptolyngbyaceae bacterium]
MGSSDGGPITLEAQTSLLADGSRITTQSNSSATGAGGDIQITARDTLMLGDRSFIDAGTVAAGVGGRIDIDAGAIALSDFSFLNTSTLGAGAAGPIRLTTTVGDVVLNDSSLFSLTAGAGNAGTITVQSAGDLLINGGSVISTSVLQGAGGEGSNITIDAPMGVFIQGTGATPELPTGTLTDGANAAVGDSFIPSGIT